MTKVLDAKDLAYRTPDNRPLIEALSFDVKLGELLTFTGPNGIGKSTLLNIIFGESLSVSGSIQWHVPMNRVGFLSQLHNREFHISLTLGDILKFSGHFQLRDIEQLSHGLLSPPQLDIAWNTASGGERQKTLLTRVFLQNPQVLILDEPMNHLDIASRQQLRGALQHFIADGQHAVIMVGHESSMDPTEWNSNKTIDLKGYIAK